VALLSVGYENEFFSPVNFVTIKDAILWFSKLLLSYGCDIMEAINKEIYLN